jgi:Zn-dependent alcohol dehydrogenase
LRAGDRVVVAGTPECGECFWCIRDQPDQCAEMLGGILPVGGKRIQSCQYGGAHIRRDIPRFAGMLEAGLLDAEPLVSRRFALEDVNEALAAALRRDLITAVIVPNPVS